MGDPIRLQQHQSYPWLGEKHLPIVIGDDLDAIMSALFMHDLLQWDVVGYYSGYNTLYIDPRYSLREVVFLDLDICYPNARSIGHHIVNDGTLGYSHAAICNSINPNLVRGVNLSNFRVKYPLATIHFLQWLFNSTVNYSNNMGYLIWMPDSAWINGQSHRFAANVESWITYFDLAFLNSTFSSIDTKNLKLRCNCYIVGC